MTSSDSSLRSSSSAEPPGFWRRLHLWGVQNPKSYYITPPSVWAVLIYVLCMIPVPEIEPDSGFSIPGFDKAVHLSFYAVLSLLIIRGWHREKMPPLGLHGFVLALCVVFGFTIELQQGLTSYRSFEAVDLVADALGAVIGLCVWQALMQRWGKRTRLYLGLIRAASTREPPSGENES